MGSLSRSLGLESENDLMVVTQASAVKATEMTDLSLNGPQGQYVSKEV